MLAPPQLFIYLKSKKHKDLLKKSLELKVADSALQYYAIWAFDRKIEGLFKNWTVNRTGEESKLRGNRLFLCKVDVQLGEKSVRILAVF